MLPINADKALRRAEFRKIFRSFGSEALGPLGPAIATTDKYCIMPRSPAFHSLAGVGNVQQARREWVV